jgi:hypothetical protein
MVSVIYVDWVAPLGPNVKSNRGEVTPCMTGDHNAFVVKLCWILLKQMK